MSDPLKVGQVWRQDDGYVCRVVAVEEAGAWVKHVSQPRSAATFVLKAWFDLWERIK